MDVEMPGQHLGGDDVPPDGVVLLVGIGADVPVVRPDQESSVETQNPASGVGQLCPPHWR